MTRRTWATVGMTLVAPLLVLTPAAAVLGFLAFFRITSGEEWWVENRTPDEVRVAPVALDAGKPLPHYPSRWAGFPSTPVGGVALRPGERRLLVIDGYIAADVGGREALVVRTARGGARYLEWKHGRPLVLDDLAALPVADRALVAELDRPAEPAAVDLPAWLIVTLGVGAPVVLWRLYRYRRTNS